jgi:hypothetical protein
LVEVCEGNPDSHRYVAGRGRDILMAFSDNCGYSLNDTKIQLMVIY